MTDTTETRSGSLISAEKIRGTYVYNAAGELLGSIVDIIIDKATGRAIYGVMEFGGLLGIGTKHHPLPWAAMKYNELLGGFMVDLDKERLDAAPSYEDTEEFKWSTEYGRKVDLYYGTPGDAATDGRTTVEPEPFIGLRAL